MKEGLKTKIKIMRKLKTKQRKKTTRTRGHMQAQQAKTQPNIPLERQRPLCRRGVKSCRRPQQEWKERSNTSKVSKIRCNEGSES